VPARAVKHLYARLAPLAKHINAIASSSTTAEGQLTLAERSVTDMQITLNKALDLLAR
jgi:hypothetical protein